MEIINLKPKYPLYLCLRVLKVTRNQLYYWKKKLDFPDKYRFFINKIKEFITRYPFYGQDRLFAIIRKEGHIINHKKFRRIYRELAICLPVKDNKSRKLDKETYTKELKKARDINQVWAGDILCGYLSTGKKYYVFLSVDIFSRDIVAWEIDITMTSQKVIDAMNRGMDNYGKPKFFRSDNGSQFRSKLTRRFFSNERIVQEYIRPGKPYENGYAESLVGKTKKEFFRRHIFDTIEDVKRGWIEYLKFYNTERPHKSLNYKTPEEVRRQSINSLLINV